MNSRKELNMYEQDKRVCRNCAGCIVDHMRWSPDGEWHYVSKCTLDREEFDEDNGCCDEFVSDY